jgi:membrane protein DedA with SNARE-associated domain
VFASHIQPLIAQYGYFSVFLIVLLESAGLPLPGETALLLAAAYAGATGHLELPFVIAAAASGAIIGDNVGFWIGRRWGADLLQRHGKLVLMTEGRIRLGQYLFERHGAKIVFFGRFVAFLRVLAALLAGINKFRWGPFLFYNAAGGMVWATIMGVGSYIFGDSLHRVSGPLGVMVLVGFVGGIAAFTFFVHREEKKLAAALETMNPVPAALALMPRRGVEERASDL